MNVANPEQAGILTQEDFNELGEPGEKLFGASGVCRLCTFNMNSIRAFVCKPVAKDFWKEEFSALIITEVRCDALRLQQLATIWSKITMYPFAF